METPIIYPILLVAVLVAVGLFVVAFRAQVYRARRDRPQATERSDDTVRGELTGDDVREYASDAERPGQPPREEDRGDRARPGADNLRRFN